MNESFIVEMWNLVREYADKKNLPIIAEKYTNLLSDHGATDQNLDDALGHDDDLDDAINNLLNIDNEDEYKDDNYNYEDE